MRPDKNDPPANDKPAVPPPAPPIEPPAPPPAPAEEKLATEPIGLTYEGDGEQSFSGVRARDHTVAELLELEAATINNITAPHPGTGKALYRLTAAGEQAWTAKHPKEHADG